MGLNPKQRAEIARLSNGKEAIRSLACRLFGKEPTKKDIALILAIREKGKRRGRKKAPCFRR